MERANDSATSTPPPFFPSPFIQESLRRVSRYVYTSTHVCPIAMPCIGASVAPSRYSISFFALYGYQKREGDHREGAVFRHRGLWGVDASRWKASLACLPASAALLIFIYWRFLDWERKWRYLCLIYTCRAFRINPFDSLATFILATDMQRLIFFTFIITIDILRIHHNAMQFSQRHTV